ncbi:MAG: HIRAN domain-containing protein [Coriobacteriia bacterium]|nr:HIRAN domain-containing protein [Coriobacteriia bacterium]
MLFVKRRDYETALRIKEYVEAWELPATPAASPQVRYWVKGTQSHTYDTSAPWRPDDTLREKYVFDFVGWLAGTSFENRGEAIEPLEPGDELVVVREPDNPYDHNACKVTTLDGAAVGYVPKDDARLTARNIPDTGGIGYVGRVSPPDEDRPTWGLYVWLGHPRKAGGQGAVESQA